MLNDLLTRRLSLVICGTAVGKRSAAVGQYYANPGNRFWRTLAALGLTPREFSPSEHGALAGCGIGLTDLVKDQAGADGAIRFRRRAAFDLRAKVMLYQPRYLCFNGKRAAQEFFGRKDVDYGVQSERIGKTVLFVAPSTSGAANSTWDMSVWEDLARRVRRASPSKKRTARS